MKQKFCQLALCLGIASVAVHASAETTGWYAGIGAGQTTVGDWLSKGDMLDALGEFGDEMGVLAFSGNISSSSDDKDTGWKIYGGYQFTPNFALEAAYLDLGEATAKSGAAGLFNVGSGFFPGSLYIKAKGEATAFVLDGIGKIAVAPWLDLFAKAGVYRSELKVTVTAGATDSGGVYEASESEKDNSTGLHAGLGADFNVTPNIAIRAEWERLSKVDFEDGETDLDMLSVSAIYRF